MKTNQARESHEPRLLATDFLAPGVTPLDGWMPFDATSGITQWNVDYNDQEGDCGFAMDDHANMAQLGDPTLVGQLFFPEFPNTLAAYYQYGLDQGEVGSPDPSKPDFGVTNATMMAWLYKRGFIKGYLEVPVSQLDWYAQMFGGACVGILLNTNTCFNEFESVPKAQWGSNPLDLGNNNAGHDVFYAKSHGDGTGWFVTWGELQPFAPAFRANITDAWVIITRNMDWVDQEKLDSVLEELHGTVTPYVAPANPAPSTPVGQAFPGEPFVKHEAKMTWDELIGELGKLKALAENRAAFHKLLDQSVIQESENILATGLGALIARLL